MSRKTSAIIYWVLVAIAAMFFFIKNNANWDILPYTACVKMLEQPAAPANIIHDETYTVVSDETNNKAFAALIDSSNQYRFKTANDPVFFSAQLCFYKVKPGYNLLNFFFKKITGRYTKGIALTSVLGWLFIALLLPLWLKRSLPGFWPYLLSLGILLIPFMIEGARTAAPDMISSAFILWALYYAFAGRYVPAMLLAVVSIFIRPDNNITAGLLIVFIWIVSELRSTRIQSMIMMIVAVVGTLWLMRLCDGYSLTEAMYADGYINNLVDGLHGLSYSFLPFFFVMTLLLFATGLYTFKNKYGRFALLLCLIPVAKFLLVPTLENRFYIPFMSAQMVLAALAIAERTGTKQAA